MEDFVSHGINIFECIAQFIQLTVEAFQDHSEPWDILEKCRIYLEIVLNAWVDNIMDFQKENDLEKIHANLNDICQNALATLQGYEGSNKLIETLFLVYNKIPKKNLEVSNAYPQKLSASIGKNSIPETRLTTEIREQLIGKKRTYQNIDKGYGSFFPSYEPMREEMNQRNIQPIDLTEDFVEPSEKKSMTTYQKET